MERETPSSLAGAARIKGMARWMRPLLAVLLGAGSAVAQMADFPIDRVPGGVVKDGAGKPVRGAKIWIRVENVGASYQMARNQILTRQPLPTVFSSRDGSFALPLTQAQRSLSPNFDGYFSLVVEKVGYRTWIEPLSAGLRGYMGSKVVLRRHPPEDSIEIRVQKPVKGMLVLLRRRAGSGTGNHPHINLDKVLPVPEDGVVKAQMSLVPTPQVITSSYSYVPLSMEVQVLFPGRSTRPIAIPMAQRIPGDGSSSSAESKKPRVIEVPANEVDGRRDPRVVAADGQPLDNVRGLYYCPDRKHRWFDLRDGQLHRDSILHPRAVAAAGCVTKTNVHVRKGRMMTLERVTTSAAERSLRVLGKDGRPLARARISCYALTDVPDIHNPYYSTKRARRVRRTDVNGIASIPDIVDREPSVLIVEAHGYNRQVVQMPRGIGARRELKMTQARLGKVEIELISSSGSPVAGAFLRFQDSCYYAGGLLDQIPRTNAKGVLRLEHMPRGNYNVQIVSPGVVQKYVRLKVQRGKIHRVRQSVENALVVRGMTVSGDAGVVPFIPIQPSISHRLKQIQVPRVMVSDSFGRFVLHGVPEQAIQVNVRPMDQAFKFVNHAMDMDGAVTKVPVNKISWLLVDMPKNNPLKRLHAYVMNTRRQSILIQSGMNISGTLVRWSPEDNVSLFFQLQKGPPVRVDADMIAIAKPELMPGEAKDGVRLLRELPVRRRVPVQLVGAGNIKDGRFRLEITNVGGGMIPYVYDDLGLGVSKAEDGKWYFVARDDSAYRGRLLHPNFRPTQFEVPEKPKSGKEEPVKVELTRAAPLSFVFKLKNQKPRPTYNLNVRVRDQKRRNYVIYWNEPIGNVKYTIDRNKVMRFRAPMGLVPGKYNVNVRIYGTQVTVNQNIEVKAGDGEVVLEWEKGRKAKRVRGRAQLRGLRAAPRPPRARVKAQDAARLRLRRLETSAAELRAQLDAVKKRLAAAGLNDREKATFETMVATLTKKMVILENQIKRDRNRLARQARQAEKTKGVKKQAGPRQMDAKARVKERAVRREAELRARREAELRDRQEAVRRALQDAERERMLRRIKEAIDRARTEKAREKPPASRPVRRKRAPQRLAPRQAAPKAPAPTSRPATRRIR